MWTTHGGRMSSPIIDGDQVIVSGLTFIVGPASPAARTGSSRFDKTTGQTIWVSAPEGRPTDTIYANPFVADVNGVRMFFSGGSDGAMHAIKVDDRRAGLELAGQQARPQHRRAGGRPGRDRHPQRREHRHERDGHGRGGAGGVEGRR